MRSVGQQGEEQAARYLTQLGYRVFARNVRAAGCELDLLAYDGDELVFVEVKTRRSRVMGYPEEAVGAQKRRHIERAAQAWMQEHGISLDVPWRVDVVAVTLGERTEILQFKGI